MANEDELQFVPAVEEKEDTGEDDVDDDEDDVDDDADEDEDADVELFIIVPESVDVDDKEAESEPASDDPSSNDRVSKCSDVRDEYEDAPD